MSAVHQPEYFPHLGDFSCAGYKTYNIDATIQNGDSRNKFLYPRSCSIHIQYGDDNCIFVCSSFNQFYDGVNRVTFYAYKYHIRFSIEFFSGSCRNPERMFAF